MFYVKAESLFLTKCFILKAETIFKMLILCWLEKRSFKRDACSVTVKLRHPLLAINSKMSHLNVIEK